jgi:hypothetical protein
MRCDQPDYVDVYTRCESKNNNTINVIVYKFTQVVNTIQSNPQICINQCPQPCYEVKYQSQVTANSWPRVNSTEYIRYSALLPTYADSLSSHLVNFDVYFQVCVYICNYVRTLTSTRLRISITSR